MLAQSVEHFTFNEGVAGSSPAQDTIYFLLNLGRLAQLVERHPYKVDVISSSLIATTILGAAVVQMVRMPPCHGGGRGFEPRPLRHLPR